MLLKASSVRALAKTAKFVEYVVIVGPSSVVTSYQIGLIAQQAFSVVEDLTPESATVHPLIPQSWGDESFVRIFLRALTSLVALGIAIYAKMSGSTGSIEIGGFNAVAIAALFLNVLSRILLRPKRTSIQSDDSPPTVLRAGAAAVAEAPAAEIATQAAGNGEEAGNGDPGDEQGTWDRFKRTAVELMPHVLASASYGLSGLSGIAAWKSWALLAVGAASNTAFYPSGATYYPLTAWMSRLVAPLFVSTWVVYFAMAVALSPVTAIVAVCAMCCTWVYVRDEPIQACTWTIVGAWSLLAVCLSISTLAGEHLTPHWVLHLSWVGWVSPVLLTVGLELYMLGWVRVDEAVDSAKGWAQKSRQMGLPPPRAGYGFGHVSATGLHVRFIPSYVTGIPTSVSVVVGMDQPDHRCWLWKG